MKTNRIEINNAVYEIDRVYNGRKSIYDIIKERLTSTDLQNNPLTSDVKVLYNNNITGMPKEGK